MLKGSKALERDGWESTSTYLTGQYQRVIDAEQEMMKMETL